MKSWNLEKWRMESLAWHFGIHNVTKDERGRGTGDGG